MIYSSEAVSSSGHMHFVFDILIVDDNCRARAVEEYGYRLHVYKYFVNAWTTFRGARCLQKLPFLEPRSVQSAARETQNPAQGMPKTGSGDPEGPDRDFTIIFLIFSVHLGARFETRAAA